MWTMATISLSVNCIPSSISNGTRCQCFCKWQQSPDSLILIKGKKITNEYDRPEFYQLLISRSTHVFQFPFQVLQYKIRMCFAVENKYWTMLAAPLFEFSGRMPMNFLQTRTVSNASILDALKYSDWSNRKFAYDCSCEACVRFL